MVACQKNQRTLWRPSAELLNPTPRLPELPKSQILLIRILKETSKNTISKSKDNLFLPNLVTLNHALCSQTHQGPEIAL